MSDHSGQYGGSSRPQVELPGQRNLYFKPESPERLFGRLKAVEDSRFTDKDGRPNRQMVIAGGFVLVGPHFVDGYLFQKKIVPVSAHLRDRVRDEDVGKLVMIEFHGVKNGTKQFGVEVGVAEIELQRLIRRSILAAPVPYVERERVDGQKLPDEAFEPLSDEALDDLPF